jgi:hypothetical protein
MLNRCHGYIKLPRYFPHRFWLSFFTAETQRHRENPGCSNAFSSLCLCASVVKDFVAQHKRVGVKNKFR